LKRDDVEALIRSVSPRALSSEVIQFIFDKTSGNPLFVVELARYLDGQGRLAVSSALDGSWEVPATIRSLIGERLRGVSQAAARMLGAAAVVGMTFQVRLLPRAPPQFPIDGMLSLIDEAYRAHLIEPGGEPGTFRFSHAMMREALYQGLPFAERAQLHWNIGLALEAERNTRSSPRFALLAHHFVAALPVGSIDKAIAYASSAGEESRDRHACEQAVHHFATALQLIEGGAIHDSERRCRLLIALGRAQVEAGQMLRALDALTEAASHAAHQEMRRELAYAALAA
jgi:predicted ATPase